MRQLDALYQQGDSSKGYAKTGSRLPEATLRRCLACAGFVFDEADTMNVLAERENHVVYRGR
eukprot:COSAG01_NODE_11599_length_1896_cov_2.312187_3_plen_62_part_00